MAVPTLITDLSTTPASNSPAGTENVFPNLDDYLRVQAAFLASIRDNSGNGWVSPYLPLNQQLAGLRNKIINGSFTINQRGITTVTPATADLTADRWTSICAVASKYNLTVAAAGATAIAAGASGNAIVISSLSAYSVGAAESFAQIQRIEGYNVADLAWGTAAAKTVTLSFIVTSSLTGTFGGSIKNSANTRSYPFTYSIPVASTHTKISVTIPGDTTGLTTDWLTTNGIGLNVVFGLGVGTTLSGTAGTWAAVNYNSATGAVSVVGTNLASWTLFNVQLEVGPVATPFEQRPIGMELALCQRYYQDYAIVCALVGTTSAVNANTRLLPVPMRAPFTITQTTPTGTGGTWVALGSFKAIGQTGTHSVDASTTVLNLSAEL